MKYFTLAVILYTLALINCNAQSNNDTEIGIIEHLDRIMPSDIKVVNEKGDTVLLKPLVNKPTVLNLVYYRCPGICTPLMDGLSDLIQQSDLQLGKDYQIFTVSFDPREGIDLARNKKRNYLNLLKKKEAEASWQFFVSDSANIAKLTDFFGFKYKKTGNDFLHAGAILVMSPQAKITRYHYSESYRNGSFFQPFEFKMSVIEARKGESQPTVNKILQYCFKYDANGKKYVLNVTRVSATLILFVALFIFLYLVIKPKLKKSHS